MSVNVSGCNRVAVRKNFDHGLMESTIFQLFETSRPKMISLLIKGKKGDQRRSTKYV
jgi:hypothetical protein